MDGGLSSRGKEIIAPTSGDQQWENRASFEWGAEGKKKGGRGARTPKKRSIKKCGQGNR